MLVRFPKFEIDFTVFGCIFPAANFLFKNIMEYPKILGFASSVSFLELFNNLPLFRRRKNSFYMKFQVELCYRVCYFLKKRQELGIGFGHLLMQLKLDKSL
jgi:hypothetical protein